MSKNSYERAAHKKSLLGGITKDLDTKGDIKNSAIETLKDVVIGVVAGGVAGSAIGRASLIIGAAVTGVAHYYGNRLGSIFGMGMMASNGFQQTNEQMKGTPKEGLEGMIEGAKERVMNFKDTFQQKLFLDKVLKKDEKKEEGTKGVGDVQYFTYPENKELGESELDMTALDRLEKQIENSGSAFSKMSGTENSDEMEFGDNDPSEMNF